MGLNLLITFCEYFEIWKTQPEPWVKLFLASNAQLGTFNSAKEIIYGLHNNVWLRVQLLGQPDIIL